MDEQDLNEKVTIGELERYHNVMFNDAKIKTNKKMRRGEFIEKMNDPKVGMVGIHQPSREAWLKSQGYDVTRENMLNTKLTSKG